MKIKVLLKEENISFKDSKEISIEQAFFVNKYKPLSILRPEYKLEYVSDGLYVVSKKK